MMLIAAMTVTGILLTLTAVAVLSSSTSIPASGTVTHLVNNLGVYSDNGYTQTATALSWGTLNQGENTTRTLYITNTGNSDVTLS